MNAKTSFANDLVVATIKNAAKLPFYRDHWAGYDWKSITRVDQLSGIPVLSKPEMLKFLAGFEYTDKPALVSHSSGTSGTITVRCRSKDEIKSLWNIRHDEKSRLEEVITPLVLSVDGANHGQMMPMPSTQFALKAVGFDHAVIQHVIQQLGRTYNFPGVSTNIQAIDAPLGFIKLLTLELMQRGIDPRTLGVRLLTTYGEYVSQKWTKWLQYCWNSNHIDRYANSECVGGATKCEKCGWFSFLPESWPEIVDPNSHETISEGIGYLAMTELYPFSQLQPMIRFVPGDIMEVRSHNCDNKKQRTFRYLGRADRALTTIDKGQTKFILFSAEVADALDSLCHLEREETFHTLPLPFHARDLAPPLCKLQLKDTGTVQVILVTLVPTFSPHVFKEEAEKLKAKTKEALLKYCSGLKNLIQSNEFAIEIRLQSSRDDITGFLAS